MSIQDRAKKLSAEIAAAFMPSEEHAGQAIVILQLCTDRIDQLEKELIEVKAERDQLRNRFAPF